MDFTDHDVLSDALVWASEGGMLAMMTGEKEDMNVEEEDGQEEEEDEGTDGTIMARYTRLRQQVKSRSINHDNEKDDDDGSDDANDLIRSRSAGISRSRRLQQRGPDRTKSLGYEANFAGPLQNPTLCRYRTVTA